MSATTTSLAAFADYREIARRYADAWNAHDVDAIMALHADDTIYHLHGEADVHRGRAAVAAKFTTQLGQVPDIRFELKSLHGGGDHFVFEAAITCSGKDGEKAMFDGIDVITIRDGLVASKNSYMVKAG